MKKIIFLLSYLILFSCFPTAVQKAKPLIVFTFDDNYVSVYDVAYKTMKKYGFKGTNFVYSAGVERTGNLTWAQLKELEDNGWKTGGHTVNHVNLPDCTIEEARYEIEQNYYDIKNNLSVPESFALPSGHASDEHFSILEQYYKNIRTSLNLSHKLPINNKLLGYFAYKSNYSYKDVIVRLDIAEEKNEALVIFGFHRFLEQPLLFPDNCKPEDFKKIVQILHKRGYKVYSLEEALNILK